MKARRPSARRRVGVVAVIALGVVATGPVAPSAAATVAGAPVNIVAAGGNGTGKMTVDWDAPASNGGASITSYAYSISADSGAWSAITSTNSTATLKTLSCTGVSNCRFRIYANNSAGRSAASTAATGVWSAPSEPRSITATGSGTGTASVTWTPPSNNGGKALSGYVVERSNDGTAYATVATAGTAARSATISCTSATCLARVRATNAIGSGTPSDAVPVAWAPPEAPATHAHLVDGALGRFEISWEPPVSTGGLTVTGYQHATCASTVSACQTGTATFGSTTSVSASARVIPVTCGSLSAAGCGSYRVRAVTSAGPGPWSAVAGTSGFATVFADEFSGTTLDSSKWAVEHSTYGDGNNSLQCSTPRPENVFVAGGTLTLRARKETTPYACPGETRTTFLNAGGRTYTSGHIWTKNKFSSTYGTYEIRAKLPTQAATSKGMWPAFWMRPTSDFYGGSRSGEIDILEAIGSGATGTSYDEAVQTLHYNYAASGTAARRTNTYTLPGGARPADGYHTYSVSWTPGELRWYVDGAMVMVTNRATNNWTVPSGATWPAPFDRPFYLIVNLAVGGDWPGSPDAATAFPADYGIDSVRVWQQG